MLFKMTMRNELLFSIRLLLDALTASIVYSNTNQTIKELAMNDAKSISYRYANMIDAEMEENLKKFKPQ